MEDISVYLSRKTLPTGETARVNGDLDLGRAHHFVLGWDWAVREDMRIKAEPYLQLLYNIPVMKNSYYSMLNNPGGYFNDSLVNKGTGMNYGVDLTIEKFLTHKFYWLFTASLFDSRYKGGDGVAHNSRYNCRYVVNYLLGREIMVRERNLLGINIKASRAGGQYYLPIDLAKSVEAGREMYDLSRIYTEHLPDFFYLDLTLTYRTNHKKFSGIWALQVKNLLNSKPVIGYTYDAHFRTVEAQYPLGIIPFLSYKVEF